MSLAAFINLGYYYKCDDYPDFYRLIEGAYLSLGQQSLIFFQLLDIYP